MSDKIVELVGISKSFPGVKALKNVSFSITRGTIHGIIGENGAGKSTLIKIISGAISNDEGKIFFNGKEVQIKNSLDAMKLGIGTVYQEMSLVPALNAVENIFLGNEKLKGIKLDTASMKKLTADALKRLNVTVDLDIPIRYLSVAQQQMIEIARNLVFDRKLIIMDEPTSSLTQKDAAELFRALRILKKSGVTIIYISHKMDELEELCDCLTVMRDGCYIDTVRLSDVDINYVISLMVGRTLDSSEQLAGRCLDGETVLSVRNLCDRSGKVKDASFDLPRGIILGFAGLVGAGRTELMRMIFGADPILCGTIEVKGKQLKNNSTTKAVRHGIAYLSEDRKNEGLLLKLPIKHNISITNLAAVSKKSVVNLKAEDHQAKTAGERVNVVTSSINKLAGELSGGNQQKVAIAKWLFTDCDILIFDEPTRGIDVGARAEIYKLMNVLVDQGKSIILVSSDLNEIMTLSNRIITMYDGKISGILDNETGLTQQKIMKQMLGGTNDAED